ncbi:MAG: methyltransferase domain-containing protein [Undibacterium sp.]|nr:methyltransferase domain-containing protein [Opitutaceae bacterium]
MENPLYTAAYLAQIADRQTALRAQTEAYLTGLETCVLEIGCGHGHFLTDYAAAHLAKTCIGLDIIFERIERANRKKNRARLTNLHFLHASAEDFLAMLPTTLRFSEVFVLFPDPWPKRRHHKNRLMQPEFLANLAQRAGQGTRLYFRTDDTAYSTATTEVVQAHPAWEITTDPWAFECETVFQQRAPSYHSLVARPKH